MDIPFGQKQKKLKVTFPHVLILIVMDIPFGHSARRAKSMKVKEVLILIVMDIPFGRIF